MVIAHRSPLALLYGTVVYLQTSLANRRVTSDKSHYTHIANDKPTDFCFCGLARINSHILLLLFVSPLVFFRMKFSVVN